MPNPISFTPLSQLPAQAAQAHFSSRPTLVSVAFAGLRQRILEHYPTLQLDLTQVKLASPLATGGHSMQLLLNVAINHLLNPQPLDFEPRDGQPFFLTQAPSAVLTPAAPATLDMQLIAQAIDDLRLKFYIDFQQALADYWNETDSHGNSRWQWLAELLRGQMIAAVTAPTPLNDVQLDMLTTVATWPQMLTRLSFAGHSEEALEARLAVLTDPAQLLCTDPRATLEMVQKVDRQLPTWLQQAHTEDRFAYHRHAQDMAQVMEKKPGPVI